MWPRSAGWPAASGDDAGGMFGQGVIVVDGLVDELVAGVVGAESVDGHQYADGLLHNRPGGHCSAEVCFSCWAGASVGVVGQAAIEVGGEDGEQVEVAVGCGVVRAVEVQRSH